MHVEWAMGIGWLNRPYSSFSGEGGDNRRHGSLVLDLVAVQRCPDEFER